MENERGGVDAWGGGGEEEVTQYEESYSDILYHTCVCIYQVPHPDFILCLTLDRGVRIHQPRCFSDTHHDCAKHLTRRDIGVNRELHWATV